MDRTVYTLIYKHGHRQQDATWQPQSIQGLQIGYPCLNNFLQLLHAIGRMSKQFAYLVKYLACLYTSFTFKIVFNFIRHFEQTKLSYMQRD